MCQRDLLLEQGPHYLRCTGRLQDSWMFGGGRKQGAFPTFLVYILRQRIRVAPTRLAREARYRPDQHRWVRYVHWEWLGAVG